MLTEKAIYDAFKAMEKIGSVSSTLAKQEILADNFTNDALKTFLFFTYNPYLQYNIKKIPTQKYDDTKMCEECSLDTYFKFTVLLGDLNKRNISGNNAINAVKEFLESCNVEEYTWYCRILKKDLGIGLATKGINKVFKKLIPEYEVLLADKIPPESLNLDTPEALKLVPNRFITQYKIDGYRLNLFVYDGGKVEMRTRNGKFVSGYTQLEKDASKLPPGFVYDGELVSSKLFDWINENMESNKPTVPNRDLFSEAMSHAFSHEKDKEGIYNIFDIIPIDEWNTKRFTEPLSDRTERLNNLDTSGLTSIRVVPTSRVFYKNNPKDMEDVVAMFHQFLEWGWEGLMIKNWDSNYECKRSKNLLKMKLMDTVDLEVIDVFEGNNKYTGMLGGVIVDYKGFKLGVGSGWKDSERQYYWDNKNEILGKTIEVAYQAETKNKDGGLSLSFPIFKSIRLDK